MAGLPKGIDRPITPAGGTSDGASRLLQTLLGLRRLPQLKMDYAWTRRTAGKALG